MVMFRRGDTVVLEGLEHGHELPVEFNGVRAVIIRVNSQTYDMEPLRPFYGDERWPEGSAPQYYVYHSHVTAERGPW